MDVQRLHKLASTTSTNGVTVVFLIKMLNHLIASEFHPYTVLLDMDPNQSRLVDYLLKSLYLGWTIDVASCETVSLVMRAFNVHQLAPKSIKRVTVVTPGRLVILFVISLPPVA